MDSGVRPLSGKWAGVRLKKPEMVSPGGILSPEVSTYPSQVVYVVEGGDSGYTRGNVVLVRSHVGIPIGNSGLTVFMNKNLLGEFDNFPMFQEEIDRLNVLYGVGA